MEGNIGIATNVAIFQIGSASAGAEDTDRVTTWLGCVILT
jgi:hypothetical protein